MMEKPDFSPELDLYIKNYIKENLSIHIFTEKDYEGRAYSVEVYVDLAGEEISRDRSVF